MSSPNPSSSGARAGDAPGTTRPSEISIICPCHDEVEVIRSFYEELTARIDEIADCTFELIFVDDGSRDGTLGALNELAAEDSRLRVCSFSRNFGHQIALSAGLDFAAGDAVVMMDSDLQHPPALIPKLIDEWRSGHDIVSAVREDTAGASTFKLLTSRGFYWFLNKLSDTHIPEGAADFCLVSRRVRELLGSMPERHRFLRGMVAWSGFNRSFVPFQAPPRAAGRSSYSFVKMLSLALDAVFSFSSVPLRLATRVGLAITVLGFAYLAWNFIKAWMLQEVVVGWASILGVTMVLGGTQLLFIGVVGQYIARMFEELKQRPMYVLAQEPQPSPFDDSSSSR